jgi:hypothetical protein
MQPQTEKAQARKDARAEKQEARADKRAARKAGDPPPPKAGKAPAAPAAKPRGPPAADGVTEGEDGEGAPPGAARQAEAPDPRENNPQLGDTQLAKDELPDAYDLAPDAPPGAAPPPPRGAPRPPPTDAPKRVSQLVAELRALHPGGKRLDVAAANAVADSLVGAFGSAEPAGSTVGASAAASTLAGAPGPPAGGISVDAARRQRGALPKSLRPGGGNGPVSVSGARPLYEIGPLLHDPECPTTARVTYMTCYTDPTTKNVMSVQYASSIGADGQLCSSCDGCEESVIEYDLEEYTSILGVYQAADGLGVAGLLHVTNMGKYLLCGDGAARHSGMVTYGPEFGSGAVGDGTNLLAVSTLQAVCAMSSTAPYLQRISNVCFSQSESWGAGGGRLWDAGGQGGGCPS